MPCNGVTVLEGQVPIDLREYVGQLNEAQAQQFTEALGAMTGAEVSLTGFGESVIRVQVRSKKVGVKMLNIARQSGRVYLSSLAGSQAEQELVNQAVDLLQAQAGMAKQQAVFEQLKALGIPITQAKSAQNGALVMSVEV